MASTQTNMRVVVRVRPFNRQEMEQNQRNIIRVMDDSNLIFDPEDDEEEFFFHGVKQTHRDMTKRVRKKMNMEFDNVFDWDSKNHEIFEVATKPLLERLMDGYNCSVFVYGATGAGKTFTMLGCPDLPGITFLTMRSLFERIEELEETIKFDFGISYVEVYNEQVMNLLSKSGPLNLRDDGNSVIISGLALKKISSASELLDLLAQGNRNRTQHPTDANAESSRSHAIFQVHIMMTNKHTQQKKIVKLSMIDLAGSERAASTQCKGLRFKEGANINKSLLALGNCINRLAEGSKYVPYRDSKLTRILKDSLGGNCQTVMIANVSPSSITYEDTYNTLKYASRAKKIKTNLKSNILQSNIPKEYLVKKVNEQECENERLRARIKELEARLAASESQNITNPKTEVACADTTSSPVNHQLEQWTKKIDEIFNQLILTQEKYYSIMSKEKILALRLKFKSCLEQVREKLNIDCLNQEISRMEASADRCGKQIQIQKEEMQRWAKRHKETIKALDEVKKDMSSNLKNKTLEMYLQNKEKDLENQKSNSKTAHMQKIISIYSTEFDHWEKMTSAGMEMLSQYYLLLRSNGIADNNMHEKMMKLHKSCQGKQKVVKFYEAGTPQKENSNDGSFDSIPSIIESPNVEINKMKSDTTAPISSSKKRQIADVGDIKPSNKMAKTVNHNFTKPKAVKAINFNNNLKQNFGGGNSNPRGTGTNNLFKVPAVEPIFKRPPVFNESAAHSMNSTFDIDKASVLTENGVNIKDQGVLDKMGEKEKTKLINRAAITLNKENKKFTPRKAPNKIGTKGPINVGISKARIKPISTIDRNNKGTPLRP